MTRLAFQRRLIAWYKKDARHNLPWRKTRDPYRILISEIMLQQTQVKKVIPHYLRFLEKFPNVESLAGAPLTSVLDAWSGLGYYYRAKNLHAAAEKISRVYGGSVPSSVDALRLLPGIGRYTAGAVASIAFHKSVPLVDGNVVRVLCRYLGIRKDPKSPLVQKKLWETAKTLVPKSHPGIFNQALMELGALLCTPREPGCVRCPIKTGCFAYRHGLQEKIPVPSAATRRKKITYLCGILERNGKLLLGRRPFSGLLPGLWEFPGGERRGGEPGGKALSKILEERLGLPVETMPLALRIRQILTHRTITIWPFRCQWEGTALHPTWYQDVAWVAKNDLHRLALTSGMLRLSKELFYAAPARPPRSTGSG